MVHVHRCDARCRCCQRETICVLAEATAIDALVAASGSAHASERANANGIGVSKAEAGTEIANGDVAPVPFLSGAEVRG